MPMPYAFINPDALRAAIGFATYFESAQQTITSAGTLTLAHGLGREPVLFFVVLKCVNAESGYSPGDTAFITSDYSDSAVDNKGVSLVPDATNLNIRFGANASVFNILNKNTGAANGLTNANWKVIFRAWA